MGLLNKLMFWKKEDDFDFDELAKKEMGMDTQMPSFDQEQKENLGLNERSMFPEEKIDDKPLPPHLSSYPSEQRGSSFSRNDNNRDFDLINSKLDTIKAILDSTERRLSAMERSLNIERKEKLW